VPASFIFRAVNREMRPPILLLGTVWRLSWFTAQVFGNPSSFVKTTVCVESHRTPHRFLGKPPYCTMFLQLDHLRIMMAQPEYLLAMKCLAIRIGAEFHDEDDIRYLLRLLEVRNYEDAVAIVTKYYPLERFPQKTLDALAELLPKPDE
jgi:hypothetical protein